MATEKTVKVLGFTYAKVYDNPYDPNGAKIVEHTVAMRGDVLDFDELVPMDQQRADKHDVFYTAEEVKRLQPDGTLAPIEAAPGADTMVLDANSSTDELADWIREDEPTVADVIELAGDDPQLARKLLEAESAATGGDPRKGVVTALEKIANQTTA